MRTRTHTHTHAHTHTHTQMPTLAHTLYIQTHTLYLLTPNIRTYTRVRLSYTLSKFLRTHTHTYILIWNTHTHIRVKFFGHTSLHTIIHVVHTYMLTFKRVHTHTHVLDSRARYLKFYIHNSYLTHTHMLTFKHARTHTLQTLVHAILSFIYTLIHNS